MPLYFQRYPHVAAERMSISKGNFLVNMQRIRIRVRTRFRKDTDERGKQGN